MAQGLELGKVLLIVTLKYSIISYTEKSVMGHK